MKSPADNSPPYDLEFRSREDDAWYTARIVLDGGTLVVKLLNFPEIFDERFGAGDFPTADAVDEFVGRIRPISEQLQDSQCWRVIEGMTVCASFAFGPDDIRFYDAIVDDVSYVEHSFAKEEEECLCSFLLFWQHGPNEGNVTSTGIASICLVQPFSELDSKVASFAKMAKEKIEIDSLKSGSVSDGKASTCVNVMTQKENSHLATEQKSSLSQHGFLEVKDEVMQFDSSLRTKEEAGRMRNLQDLDFGGEFSFARNLQDKDFQGKFSLEETGNHHFILVDNLERDLSPSSIMEFVHKQTSILPQAYVFPSLSSESYTRGAIVLDCKKKLKKIFEFLNSPDHIVMSSRGRPWVVIEKFLRCGNFRTTLGSLMAISQCKFQNRSINDELKVFHRGVKEYDTANRLRDLFTDFVEHQQRLHKRLALQEKKILQLLDTV